METFSDIHERVGAYYDAKLAEHGATHRGVDWNSEASQQLRFDQLLRVADLSRPFSLNDYGCGHGSLAAYLAGLGADVRYHGYDVSEAMVATARERLAGEKVAFTTSRANLAVADVTVASGIFNVLAGTSAARWERYVEETIRDMASVSRRGIAFNMLTSYSDADRMTPRLHYADPLRIFDWCKRNLARRVALLHDYELYEFTMIVRLGEGAR